MKKPNKITEFRVTTGGKAASGLLSEVEGKFNIDGHIESMLLRKNFTTSTEAREVQFAIKSLDELGFLNEPTFNEIIRLIRGHKEYEPCQAEDGPALRLAYSDQPIGEFIDLIMEELPDANGHKSVFTLYHDHYGIWLGRRMHGEKERFSLKSKEFVVRLRG